MHVRPLWPTAYFCGWDIANKRLGPPGSIHVMDYLQEAHRPRIGIFAPNVHGISDLQELLQKQQDVTTPEYPHRPYVIISGDLHCVPDNYIKALPWTGSGVLQGSTRWRYNAFPFSISPTQDFPRSHAVHKLTWPAYEAGSFIRIYSLIFLVLTYTYITLANLGVIFIKLTF